MTHLSLPAPESGCHSVTDSLKSLNGCKNSSSLAARSLYSLLRLWVQAEFKAPGLHSESSWKWKKKKSGKCFWGETKTDWLTQNIKWEEFFFFGWKNPQQRHWLNQVVCYSQQEPDRAFHLAKYPTADDKYLTPFSRWSAHRNTDTVAGVKPPHPPPPLQTTPPPSLPHSSPAGEPAHLAPPVWSQQCRSVFMNLLSGAESSSSRGRLPSAASHNISASEGQASGGGGCHPREPPDKKVAGAEIMWRRLDLARRMCKSGKGNALIESCGIIRSECRKI